MGGLQPIHLIIVLVIVVLLFGGSKIPELMKGVGKGMGEFKKGLEEGKRPEDPLPAPAQDDLQRKQAELEAEKKRLAQREEELRQLQAKSGEKS